MQLFKKIYRLNDKPEKMKKFTSLLILSFIFLNSFALKVELKKAETVARNFLSERTKSINTISLEYLYFEKSKTGSPLFYIFNINKSKGFIIISGDDRIRPILAYSFESDYSLSDKKPDAFLEWFQLTEKQINFVIKNKLKRQKKVTDAWNYYSDSNFKASKNSKDVAPLLTTTWNQGCGYNSLCPETATGGSCGHVWAGCVAVSMAQVINFWNYPDYGSGEHTYTHSVYGEQSADFANTYYNWANMPDNSGNTDVATLLYHCGVAVNMNYSPSGSGAYMSSAENALKRYFDYSQNIRRAYKSAYTEEAWDSLVRSQIELGQPMSYAGGSHAYNIDGYQGSNYFHLNWGWGGSYNGYYYLDDLTPGGYNFTSGQVAIINIRPNCGDAPTETDTITDYSGTLYDNGGSYYNYNNCSNSTTLIAPPGATNIYLSFAYFNSVSGQDTLFVYNGEDDMAPVLLAITGDTIPDDILSTTGKVFLKFTSDNFTTERGYQINYTSSFDDAGVTRMLLPVDRTCGRSDDSLLVVIKNYGINTQTSIPVVIKAETPRGLEIYEASLNNPPAMNESDTLFVGTFSTTETGSYDFTCYTNLSGDSYINANDTVKKSVFIKDLQSIPFYENVDSLHWDMHDWTDRNWTTWINTDPNGKNAYFSAWVSDYNKQFFMYDRKIEHVTPYTGIYFDYRIQNGMVWPPIADTLNADEKIYFILSSDCGTNFDTLFTIDENNHIPDTLFKTHHIPLSEYAGEDVIFGFTTDWDSVYSVIDYDNILVIDSINNNHINGSAVCEEETINLTGSSAKGGIGELSYLWQESSDGNSWNPASSANNLQNYEKPNFTSSKYFRRIVSDTLFYADTSNVIFIEALPSPDINLSADTEICIGDTVTIEASGGDTFLWETNETSAQINVSPVENTYFTVIVTNNSYCSAEDSVYIAVNPLPEVDLGNDTTICEGENITLDAGNFNTYQWNTGAETQTITADTSGMYMVTISDLNECKNSDSIIINFETCSNIQSFTKNNLNVYPNPSRGIYFIDGLNITSISKITITDVRGKTIRELKPDSEIITLNLQNEPSGMYFIRISSKKENLFFKILKQD